MFVRFQFRSTTFAELVRDQIARSDVGCIPPTGQGFVVERIVFPRGGEQPMDIDHSGDVIVTTDLGADGPAVATEAIVAGPMRLGTDPVVLAAVAEARRIRIPRPGDQIESPFETITIPVVGRSPIEVRRRKLLLTLPVTLTIRSIADMIANTSEALVITIDIRLKIDLVHRDDGRDYVRVAFGGVGHREGNDPAIEGLIRAELAGTDVAREVVFDYTEAVLRAVGSLGGGVLEPTVAWSGMSLTPDREAVELRAEVTFDDVTGTVVPDEWQRFLTRQFDDFRTDHDWATEITRDLLDVTATAGALDQIGDVDDFDLDSGPFVDWRPDYPGFRTRFAGEAVDACTCGWEDIDVNVSVEVQSRLRLARPGRNPTIEVDTHLLEPELTNGWEQACCFITGTALFPILGWKYLAEGKLGWGPLALGMLHPIAGAAIAMGFFFGADPSLPTPEDCRKEGAHQICTYEISLNPPVDPCDPPSATISLDLLRGRTNGLVLAGAVQQPYRAAPQVAASRPTAFEWHGPKPTCNGPVGEWSARSDFKVTQVGGGFPLDVCEAIAVGPTAPIYKPHLWHTTRCPTTGDVAVRTVPWTPGNPDPAPILVLTNVGATLVMVPALPPLEPEQEDYDRFFARWRHTNCRIYDPNRLADSGKVESSWLVGSPADGPTRRLWVIRAGGLDEGELLAVSGAGDGELLATAVGAGGKGVRLDLLHDGDGVLIDRRRADGSPGGRIEDAKVSISQVLLEQVDEHGLGGPAQGLRTVGPPDRAVIEVDLDGGREQIHLRPGGAMARKRRTGWSVPAATGPHEAIRSSLTARRDRAPSDEVREVAATLQASTGDRIDVVRLVPTVNAWRWIAHASDGFVEIDGRVARVTNRYRDRPWFDGMASAGEIWARLDDDRTTLRTYRARDSVTL